ncbi:Cyclopropane-fatty-acyl-phospholipid synthase (EC 2.1.1.79) [uncultured Gammaproteobacteria bacterium]|nr:Cyclopropane-fatty-acyl-phospholipid synthase (EC 2.1.1.79) [uncultured Gammaproteobacteria bacterium]CAC9958787.1 Cyclopropane-fatty-acyl-phospholipid synthase (EC 2.1.1.79) [uncultured Gammaproteobacteria bacterium]
MDESIELYKNTKKNKVTTAYNDNIKFFLCKALLSFVFFRKKISIKKELGSSNKVILRHHDFVISTNQKYLINLVNSAFKGNADICLGEGYMYKNWTLKGDLVCFLYMCFQIMEYSILSPLFKRLQKKIFQKSQNNTPFSSRKNVSHHYDIGNILYKTFLDSEMNYSSGIFRDNVFDVTKNEDAQKYKNNLIVKLLDINSDNNILEIGCGWGSLSRMICKHVPATVTGISLSEEQINWCNDKKDKLSCKNTKYVLEDYRDFCRESANLFDKVVSVEMFDHVGKKHHSDFFKAIYDSLTVNGVLVMQLLIRPKPSQTTQWIDKYIFPGAYISSFKEVEQAFSKAGFIVDNEGYIEYDGHHYATTLQNWKTSFNKNFNEIKDQGYSDAFKNMWNFYLASSEMVFRNAGFKTIHLRLKKKEVK